MPKATNDSFPEELDNELEASLLAVATGAAEPIADDNSPTEETVPDAEEPVIEPPATPEVIKPVTDVNDETVSHTEAQVIEVPTANPVNDDNSFDFEAELLKREDALALPAIREHLDLEEAINSARSDADEALQSYNETANANDVPTAEQSLALLETKQALKALEAKEPAVAAKARTLLAQAHAETKHTEFFTKHKSDFAGYEDEIKQAIAKGMIKYDVEDQLIVLDGIRARSKKGVATPAIVIDQAAASKEVAAKLARERNAASITHGANQGSSGSSTAVSNSKPLPTGPHMDALARALEGD